MLIAVSALILAAAPPTRLSLFEDGQHCVAYKAKKRLFLLRTVDVVGTSCEVAAQVIPELDDQYRIEVSFPVVSLKSGEEKRDMDVARLLQSEREAELLFTSQSLSLAQWKQLAAKGRFTLQGKLRIGADWHPLQAEIQLIEGRDGKEVEGLAHTDFKSLNLKAPTLGLGLVATVKNELELHFHLVGTRVLGMDTLVSK